MRWSASAGSRSWSCRARRALNLLCTAFTRDGAQSLGTTTVADEPRLAPTFKSDVVVCDLDTPGNSELLPSVRARVGPIPAVAHGSIQRQRQPALRLGFRELSAMRFDLDELLDTLAVLANIALVGGTCS
jgi:hypothetical protein